MRTISTVKASLFTLILAFMVIGTIAIAEVMKKGQPVEEERAVKTATEVWFIFTSPLNPDDDEYEDALTDQNNYDPTHSSTPPTTCPTGSDKVCAVKTIPSSNPNLPDSDALESLLSEMTSENPDPSIVRLKLQDINP